MRAPWHRSPAKRPSIGYALSGGAVRGVAHLGFLSVFEEAGIRPDFVVGTSAGAVVGAGYAMGLSVEAMREMVRAASWREVTGAPRLQRLSVFTTSPLRQWLGNAMGGALFEDLEIPFAAVACDIIDGEKVVLRSGSVVEAAVASCAIPGLFAPVEHEEALLVDGGVVDNLPVEVVRQLGADLVIAVDVSPLWGGRRPETLRDLMESTVSVMTSAKRAASRAEADFVVVPETQQFSSWDFARVDEIFEVGRQAALAVVPDVLDRLGTSNSG